MYQFNFIAAQADSVAGECQTATPPAEKAPAKKIDKLIRVFAQAFVQKWRTQIVGGASEPLYEPAADLGELATIYFTRDYFSSALHEVAHWCVAGEARRKLVDYGYWYAPDGRSPDQQQAFEKVEVLPQAMEWIFSVASGEKFSVSADNLENHLGASEEFKVAIWQQAQYWCENGLPERASIFAEALAREFKQCEPLIKNNYKLSDI